MTGGPATRRSLEQLLREVADAADGRELACSLGTPGPGWRWPDGMLVSEPREVTFAGIEIRPWEGGTTGVVEVTFRPGLEPSWAELREWYAPMEELPVLDDAPRELIAVWTRPGAPAELRIIVEEPEDEDAPVSRLTIRRDPSR